MDKNIQQRQKESSKTNAYSQKLDSDEGLCNSIRDLRHSNIQNLSKEPANADHAHLALIYETREELFGGALPFLQAGLEQGERCIYVTTETPQAELLKAMDTADYDFAAAREAGDLSFLSEEAYLTGGEFDPERMIDFLKGLTTEVTEEKGYTGLRIADEATWALADDRRINNLVKYEKVINNFFKNHACTVLCIYNRRQFPPKVLEEVIRTHPQIVYNGTVVQNFYYVPPGKHADGENSLQTVERQMQSLVKYTHELRQSEKHYRALVAASSDVIYRLSPDWSEIRELQGQRFPVDKYGLELNWIDKYILPDDRQQMKQAIDDAIQNKSVFELEHRILRENGTIGWLFTRAIPLVNEKEEIVEWFGTVSNVTRRKQTEQALRESKERLQLSLDVGGMGLWEFDFRNKSLTLSEMCKQNLQLEPDADLSFKQFQQMVHPEDRKQWTQKLRTVSQGGEALSAEFRFYHPEGKLNWIYARGRMLSSGERSPDKITGISQNITARKQREKLEQEKSRLLKCIAEGRPLHEVLSALCETVPQLSQGVRASIVFVDDEGSAFQESIAPDLLPSWSKKTDGTPVNDLMIGTCGEAVFRGKAIGCKNIKEDGRWSHEWRKLCMENGIMATHSEPVFDNKGTARGSFMLCFSKPREPNEWELQLVEFGARISGVALEHNRAKKMRREYNERLEEQVEKRTKKMVSYQGKLRELVKRLSQAEEQERRRLAGELHDNLGQMLAVIKMKLDFINLKNKNSHIGEASKLLDEAIAYSRELMSSLKPPDSLGDKNFITAVKWVIQKMEKYELAVDLEDDGKPKPLDGEARSAVLRALRELLFNVLKHSGEKKALVKLSRANGEVQVVVEDEGQGFKPDIENPPDEINKGFGLFDIQERLDLMEGNLKIVSAPDDGTRATITIPIAGSEKTESESTSGEGRQLEAPFIEENESITVMLVDDHDITREGLNKIVEKEEGLEIVGEASNGVGAVEKALELAPDVIVMDINMPEMNGIEATKKIKAEWPDIQIIGLSFHTDGDIADEMRKAGASAFVTKSKAVERLCETIRGMGF
jgi:PAS domain S-box-containing protein